MPISRNPGKDEHMSMKTIMKGFYGRTLKRLPTDREDSSFSFEHASGIILKLIVKSGKPIPRENQNVIVMGELVGAGVLLADVIYPDDEAAVAAGADADAVVHPTCGSWRPADTRADPDRAGDALLHRPAAIPAGAQPGASRMAGKRQTRSV